MPLSRNEKPRFFYGYVIVAAAFVIMALAFGINYSFGIFFKPLIAEFGWTRAVTSGAYSLMTLVSGFLGIFAGRISDRFGAKVVGIAGGLFLGLGFFLLAQVNDVWQLYLFYGLIIAPGIGAHWPALMSAVAKWFVARRGLMTGIVASGTGFGIVLTPLLASWLISTYDWRLAYIVVGISTMVLMVVAAQFLKRDPYQIGQLPYGEDKVKQGSSVSEVRGFNLRETIHTRQFWIVCAIYFCFGFGLHAVMVHIVPHATELGISTASAANILVAIGGTSIVGRITIGGASDRLGVKSSFIFTLSLMLATFFWLLLAKELWMLYLFGIVFGFAYGGIVSLQVVLVAELFGLSSLGVILGSVAFIYTIGGAVAPVLSGYIFDITGSYNPAFLTCTVISAIGLMLTLLIKPTRREGETNDQARSA